jgi:G3E family GTPase
MKIFIIGGYLGSGKSTIVLKLLQKLAADDKKIALLINELGKVKIDDDALKAAGVSSKTITDGCICCTLQIGLKAAVTELVKTYDPDVLVMEMAGLALPNQTKEAVFDLDIPMTFAPIVMLVDVSKFTVGLFQFQKFAEQQFKESEIIAINKIDLADAEKIGTAETFLKQVNPSADVLCISADKDEKAADQIYDLCMKEETTIQELLSKFDNGSAKDAFGVADQFAKVSNVSAYSGVYHVFGNLPVEGAGALFEEMVTAMGREAAAINTLFAGHMKAAVKISGSTLIKVSQTTAFGNTQIKSVQEKIENVEKPEDEKFELRLLLAVTNVPKNELENIMDRCVHLFLNEKGWAFEKQK